MTAGAIGDLRHRLTIEAVSRVDDGAGGATETWSPVAEVFAAIRFVSGREVFVAHAVAMHGSHVIRIRHRDDITTAMRFTGAGRVYDIRAIRDLDDRRQYLECLCEERLP